jgi:hypothetical protein
MFLEGKVISLKVCVGRGFTDGGKTKNVVILSEAKNPSLFFSYA